MDLVTLTLREIAADLPINPELEIFPDPAPSHPTHARITLRRCRSREQGLALLTVGHAIEYLVQSRLIQQPTTTGAEREALAILLNANLSVYNEGAEIVPVVSRLRRWFHGGTAMKPSTAAAH